jgi:parallel beta-helix repeat protein
MAEGTRMVSVRRAFTLALLMLPLASAAPAHAEISCDRVVAPGGSDSAAGTADAPYRTLAKLNASLRSGQTGCLRAGTWHEALYVKTAGVTITSYPGERARVVGETSIAGDGSTVQYLDLVGTRVSPLIYGDGATYRGNDVTNNHQGMTCFLVGDSASRVKNAVVEGNTIHDCGRLPSTNLDHGIYVLNSSGLRITGNTFYGNADWGVHLYPHADDTLVSGNVIDGNGKGVTFAGNDSSPSQGNVVEHNVISNATLQDNIQSYFGAGGVWRGGDLGNVARDNCVWGGRDRAAGGVNLTYRGYSASGNVIADPLFADREAHDYRLAANSPCRSVVGDGVGADAAAGLAPAKAHRSHKARKAARKARARKLARKRARARAAARRRAKARAAQHRRKRERAHSHHRLA